MSDDSDGSLPLPRSPNGRFAIPHDESMDSGGSDQDLPGRTAPYEKDDEKCAATQLGDIPYPSESSRAETKDNLEAEMEIPLPPDSSESKYSPTQAVVEDASPVSETQQPKKTMKVLGHAQAKKRLQAFSAAKLAAVTSATVKKSPLKGVSVFSGRKDDSSKQQPTLAIASIKEEETKMREILAMNSILNEKLKTVHAITGSLPGPGPVTAIVKPTVIHPEFSKPPVVAVKTEAEIEEKFLVKKNQKNIRKKRASSSSSRSSGSRSKSPIKKRDQRSRSREREKERNKERDRLREKDRYRDRRDRNPEKERRRSRSPVRSRQDRPRSRSPKKFQQRRSPEQRRSRSPKRKSLRSDSREKVQIRTDKSRISPCPRPSSKKQRSVSPSPRESLSRDRPRSRSRSVSVEKIKPRRRSRSQERSEKRRKSPKQEPKGPERRREREREKDRESDRERESKEKSREVDSRREREKQEAAERELDKVRNFRMPEDWNQFKKLKYSSDNIRNCWNLLMEEQEKKSSKDVSPSRSGSVSPKRSSATDVELPVSLAKISSRLPALIKTVQIELSSSLKRDYPAFCVKTTKHKPPLKYGCNPLSSQGYYKSRDQVFKEENPALVKLLLAIINGATKNEGAPPSPRKSQEWFADSANKFCPSEGTKAVVISHLYSDEEVEEAPSVKSSARSDKVVSARRSDVETLSSVHRHGEETGEEELSSDSSPESVPSPLLKQTYLADEAKEKSGDDESLHSMHDDKEEEMEEEGDEVPEVVQGKNTKTVTEKKREEKGSTRDKKKKEKKEKKKDKLEKRSHHRRHKKKLVTSEEESEAEVEEQPSSHSEDETSKVAKHRKGKKGSEVAEDKKSRTSAKSSKGAGHKKPPKRQRKHSVESPKASASSSNSQESSSESEDEKKDKRKKKKKRKSKKRKSRKNEREEESSDEEHDKGGNAGGLSGRGDASRSSRRDKDVDKERDRKKDRSRDRGEKRKTKSKRKSERDDEGDDSAVSDSDNKGSESSNSSSSSSEATSSSRGSSFSVIRSMQLDPQIELALQEISVEDKTDSDVYNHLLKTGSYVSVDEKVSIANELYDPFREVESTQADDGLVRNEPYKNSENPASNCKAVDVGAQDLLKSLDNDPMLVRVMNHQPVSTENFLASISEPEALAMDAGRLTPPEALADRTSERETVRNSENPDAVGKTLGRWSEIRPASPSFVEQKQVDRESKPHESSAVVGPDDTARSGQPWRSYSHSRSRSRSRSPTLYPARRFRRSRSHSASPSSRRCRRSVSQSPSPESRRPRSVSRSITPEWMPRRSRSRSISPERRTFRRSHRMRERRYAQSERYSGRRSRHRYDDEAREYRSGERSRRSAEYYQQDYEREYRREHSPDGYRQSRSYNKLLERDRSRKEILEYELAYREKLYEEDELGQKPTSSVSSALPFEEVRESSPMLKLNVADSTISDSELPDSSSLGFPIIDDSRTSRSNLKQIELKPDIVADTAPGYTSPPKRLSLDERLEVEMGIKLSEAAAGSGDSQVQINSSLVTPGMYNPTSGLSVQRWTGPHPLQDANKIAPAAAPMQSQAIPLGDLIKVLPGQMMDRPFTVTKDMSKLNPFEVQQTAAQVFRKEGDDVSPSKCVTIKVPVVPFKIPVFSHADDATVNAEKENQEEKKRQRRERKRLEDRKKQYERKKLKRKILERKKRTANQENLESKKEMEPENGSVPGANEENCNNELIVQIDNKVMESSAAAVTEDTKDLEAMKTETSCTTALEGAELEREPKVEANVAETESMTTEDAAGESSGTVTEIALEQPCEEAVEAGKIAEPVPVKGILYITGLKKEKSTKAVKFADGVIPGDGSSLSEAEEIHSPPPLPANEASVSKKRKKRKAKTRRKEKRRIVNLNADIVTSVSLTSPPPPPTTAYPYCPLGILYQFNPPYAIVYAQSLTELGFEITFVPSMELPKGFDDEMEEKDKGSGVDDNAGEISSQDISVSSIESKLLKRKKRKHNVEKVIFESVSDDGTALSSNPIPSKNSHSVKNGASDLVEVQPIPTILSVKTTGKSRSAVQSKSRSSALIPPVTVRISSVDPAIDAANEEHPHLPAALEDNVISTLENGPSLPVLSDIGRLGTNPLTMNSSDAQQELDDGSIGMKFYERNNIQCVRQADEHFQRVDLHRKGERKQTERRGPGLKPKMEKTNPNLIQISPLKVFSLPEQTNELSVLQQGHASECDEDLKVTAGSAREHSSPKDEFAPIPVINRNTYQSKIKTAGKRGFSRFTSVPVVSHSSPVSVIPASPSLDASDVSFNVNSVTVPIVSSSHHSEPNQACNLIPANEVVYSPHTSEVVPVQTNPPNVMASAGHVNSPVFASATMIPGIRISNANRRAPYKSNRN